jgi:hypothetical protein
MALFDDLPEPGEPSRGLLSDLPASAEELANSTAVPVDPENAK